MAGPVTRGLRERYESGADLNIHVIRVIRWL